MSNGTQTAVTEATRVGEIGFPQFTSQLITDVFNALVSANLRQTQSYLELVQQISKDITIFINDTKDDITGDQILNFLAKTLPDVAAGTTKVIKDAVLTTGDVTVLKNALTIKNLEDTTHSGLLTKMDGTSPVKLSDPSGLTNNPTYFQAILDAVAKRIAADKYTLLQEMVKMGLLRLVVEHGVIETRLTFNTYGSTYYTADASDYRRTTKSEKTTPITGLFSFLFGDRSKDSTTNSLTVSTTKSTDRDISGSAVQIFGRVQIDFKTDYQPLKG